MELSLEQLENLSPKDILGLCDKGQIKVCAYDIDDGTVMLELSEAVIGLDGADFEFDAGSAEDWAGLFLARRFGQAQTRSL